MTILESNIKDDLYVVLDSIGEDILNDEEYSRFEEGELSFKESRMAFKRANYKNKDIYEKLIECLIKQNNGFSDQIKEIENKKQKIKCLRK